MSLRRVALAWFRQEDWPQWCAMDPDFQPDYQHWLRRMDALFEKQKAAGVTVVKVVIEPAEFLKWSKAHDRKGLPTSDRAAFAAWKAAQGDLH